MERTPLIWILGLITSACLAAGNGKQATQSTQSAIGDKNWCTADKQSLLARWKEGAADMRLAYCQSESTETHGVTVFSRLDVRQEEVTSGKTIWKIHDETKMGMTKVNLFRPGFEMLDIDGDGSSETFIGYFFPGDGLEPVDFKFLAHMDGKKFAIRGQIPRSKEDAAEYKAIHDPAFSQASPRLRVVADSLFIKFIKTLCTHDDLGLDAPVPVRILPG